MRKNPRRERIGDGDERSLLVLVLILLLIFIFIFILVLGWDWWRVWGEELRVKELRFQVRGTGI